MAIALVLTMTPEISGQGTTSGGFKGVVRDRATQKPIPGAKVVLKNQQFGTQSTVITDENGNYLKTSLAPGDYDIEVSADGYVTSTQTGQTLYAMANYPVEPNPFNLEAVTAAVSPTPVVVDPTTPPTTPPAVVKDKDDGDREGQSISMDPRRVGIFDRGAVSGLPLGSSTLTRTFDELALLVVGVNPPPQAIGNTVGPGVGGGVGTSGQFSVNGLRSRANNFTVDGSDNNDEDIGVRRQGFFSLVPQPIESIQEYQITTLLAPAEFGRNLGAQVNALSRSGGNQFHGNFYGMFNSERLNAKNFFDNDSGNSTTGLTGRRSDQSVVPVFIDGVGATVTNGAGDKDEMTLFQGGFAFGGPIVKNRAFFFISGEGQELDGTQERHFAVPTVEQRGFVGSGATGLQQCQLDINRNCVPGATFNFGFPTSIDGDAVFSLFPFANDPNGVFGRNTYTEALSTDARGLILSGKIDLNLFRIKGNQQVLTARYNYSDDERDLTDVGGAIFSAVRPIVRTDNFSTYLTGSITATTSNELRFSWGRTRLRFDELRDQTGFLRPITRAFNNPQDGRFLLNARRFFNDTLPVGCSPAGCFAPNRADYSSAGTTELSGLGLIGQLHVAGFSSVGVDVFNFPQSRVNDTYQLADTFRWQRGRHSFSFGADIRRTFLESDLPRNSRPLVTFNGAPDGFDLCSTAGINCASTPPLSTNQNACGLSRFCAPTDLAAVGGASGFFQSLVLSGRDSMINLRYNQINLFGQDDWRLRPNVLLTYGLRYDYNTVPEEEDGKIEGTFSQTLPSQVSQLSRFIDGRSKIFDPDKNNFAPRVGLAVGIGSSTVVRGGFGIYFDQVLGAVVSQSRNVFPTFTTANFGGGLPSCQDFGGTSVSCSSPNAFLRRLELLNPLATTLGGIGLIQNGTLNTINPAISQSALLNGLLTLFPNFNFNGGVRVAGSPYGATLPERNLETPFSRQYAISVEHRLFRDSFLTVAYVGTQGRKLMRFSNPNLGSNYVTPTQRVDIDQNGLPFVNIFTLDPTSNIYSNLFAGRPSPLIGPISRFETSGESRYDSVQVGLRGRMMAGRMQYNLNYVRGTVKDDVSDVFDLAGSSALPQNSVTPSNEYAPANFDARHRLTYSFIFDGPTFKNNPDVVRYLFGGWQMSSSGRFNTGQPFTVNSIYDVNLDGNLTDRLNNTAFIGRTDDRFRPLSLTCTRVECESMLAAFGRDGAVGRNSFRASSVLDLDFSLSRRFAFTDSHNLQFRMDIFNFIDRANFGIPVRFLEAPGFGRAVETITPGRRIQFGLKYNF